MLELPWTHGPSTHPAPGVALASRLELARARDVPGFLLAALRLYRGFRAAEGGGALTLAAAPFRRTFWTLSTWDDEAAVRRYHRSPAHAGVVGSYRGRIAASTFVTWPLEEGARPSWAEAHRRVGAEEAGDAARA